LEEKLQKKLTINGCVYITYVGILIISSILNILYLFDKISKNVCFTGISCVWIMNIILVITNCRINNRIIELKNSGIELTHQQRINKKLFITAYVLALVLWFTTWSLVLFAK